MVSSRAKSKLNGRKRQQPASANSPEVRAAVFPRVESAQTRRVLQRMVTNLTSHHFWHEDLVQEALIHLWQTQWRCPGQKAAWYLRSCQFHLRNCLRQGRSIDSLKRRHGGTTPHYEENEPGSGLEAVMDPNAETSMHEHVMARDLVAMLVPWLTSSECQVLACLAGGLGVREVARQLNVSHTYVVQKRLKIAAVLSELEPEYGLKA